MGSGFGLTGCFHPSLKFLSILFLFVFSCQFVNQIKPFNFFRLKLNPPIMVFSNTLVCSASVVSAIKHLLLSLCTHLLNELAELHFLGLNLKSFANNKIVVQIFHIKLLYLENCKLYTVHLNFLISLLCNFFFTFSYSSFVIMSSLKLEREWPPYLLKDN